MFGFSSYHWPVAELSAGDRRAVAALDDASPELPVHGYATHDPDGLFAAFRTLLHSTDVRARGVALDQYAYAEAQGRWSVENPLALFDDDVLAEARRMLATAPHPGAPLTGQDDVLAGWRSALAVLTNLGADDAGDLPRIMAVVDAMAAADALDAHPLWTVEVRLDAADAATRARVGDWLAGLVADERLPLDVRVQALRTLGDSRPGVLAGLLDHADLRLAVEAAQILIEADPATAPRVRRVVDAWPVDAPYPASEVRYRLQEADELAGARAVLAAPAPDTVDDALRTVAEYGTAADLPAVVAVLAEDDLARAAADTFADAAGQCLRGAEAPDARRACDALSTVYGDARRPVPVRVLALRPLWRRPEYGIDTGAVTALMDHDDLRLATAAALALADRPGAEEPVRAAVARWPADAPYPADRLREIVADYDELAAARAVLAAPGDAADVIDAVHTVTYDGDDTDGPRLLALAAADGFAAVFARADRAEELELAWKLRAALLRLPDKDDPRYAVVMGGLTARLTGSR